MVKTFRIPVTDEYIIALGRAMYNFAYLEKLARDLIFKIDSDASIPENAMAGNICEILQSFTKNSVQPHNVDLQTFCSSFKRCVFELRNKFIHASPYTSKTGDQQIIYKNIEWEIDKVIDAAYYFEEVVIRGSEIYFKSEWDKIIPAKVQP